MSTSEQTHDHKKIQKWAEEHGGVPAKIKDTGKTDSTGLLRIHFPKQSKSTDFEEISWDNFFKNFDKHKLDLLYQDEKADGEESTFHKFVERN